LRLLAMLDEFAIGGLKTNIAFLRRILAHPAFAAAELDTGFIPRHQEVLLPAPRALPAGFWEAAAEAWLQGQPAHERDDDAYSPWAPRSGLRLGLPSRSSLHLQSGGESQAVALERSAASTWHLEGEQLGHDEGGVRRRHLAVRRGGTLFLRWDGEVHAIEAFDPIAEAEASHSHQGGLGAPMNGSIVRVLVEPGQVVEAGTALVVLEAMKMEHSIRAPQGGTVKALFCQEGDMVSEGTVLVELAE
ncbi:MAG TPA: biotin/lipoyl-containing protein, partial [Pseudomonas sp.]|nr:biotin/lipoyl-containing protein [Pseudomonas sp.]